MNSYQVGDQVRVSVAFTNTAGTAADPTTITLLVKQRQRAVATYTFAAGQVTKTATGAYYRDVDVTEEGIWDYRWVGTGAVVAAAEGSFNVPDSQFF